MVRNVQPLLNFWLRPKCNSYLMFYSVPFKNLLLKCSAVHHITRNTPVCGVQIAPRFLSNNIARNKYSKNIPSLIQQSPKSYVYYYHEIVGRCYSTGRTHQSRSNRSTLIYTTAVAIVVLGLSYAAVPLYRMFCQVSSIQVAHTTKVIHHTGYRLRWHCIH